MALRGRHFTISLCMAAVSSCISWINKLWRAGLLTPEDFRRPVCISHTELRRRASELTFGTSISSRSAETPMLRRVGYRGT